MASGDQPVKSVTIVGGGTAGWMTAAVLSQWLSQVEDQAGRIRRDRDHRRRRSDHPAHPQLSRAGRDRPAEDDQRDQGDASSSASSSSTGARRAKPTSTASARSASDMLWLHPHHLWLAARDRAPGSVKHFDHYALNCVACTQNKFAFPDKRNPSSPIADIDYAYHFDASLFARFLRGESEARGVNAGRGTDRRSDPGPRERLRQSREADGRTRSRRRPVRRLLGHARAADRRCAGRRLRGLEPVAALRPGAWRCRARAFRRSRPIRGRPRRRPAGNGGSRCSTGSATAMSMRPT